MGEYRKKPVVIEAVQFSEYEAACAPSPVAPEGGDLWKWMHDHGQPVLVRQDQGPAFLTIGTLEGEMRADIGDWIIRGVQGEFYPCKPSIFAATYDPA